MTQQPSTPSPHGTGFGHSDGKGLGVISAKYFKPETWTPLLGDDMGRMRYGKFVAAMMGRFRFQESTADEVRSFVALVASDTNHNLMRVALPLMPEITSDTLQDPLNPQSALHFHKMRNAVRNRANADARRDNAALEHGLLLYRHPHIGQHAYANGLSEGEKERLRGMVFTSVGGRNSEGMERLWGSWMAMGYPQSGLNQLMQEAKERGTDIERDCLGLPKSLRVTEAVEDYPHADMVRAPLTTSADRSAGTSAVATPASTPSAGASPVRGCGSAPAGVVTVRMGGR